MNYAILPALHDVFTVARLGSIAAAAAELHKSPSAVSQQVSRVEEHWDVVLFERVGRGLRMSAAADQLLPLLDALFVEAERVDQAAKELTGRAVQTLRVAASDYLGRALLVPVLQELAGPGAPLRVSVLTVHSADAVGLVQRGQVDLALVTLSETPVGLTAHTLLKQPFYWVGSKTHRGALHRRLSEHPVLRLSPGSVGRRLLDGYLDVHDLLPSSTVDVPSVSLLMSYALAGVGTALAPALATTEPHARRLRWERADLPALPVRCLHRRKRLSAASKRFIEHLDATAQGLAEGFP